MADRDLPTETEDRAAATMSFVVSSVVIGQQFLVPSLQFVVSG